jgi:hypothetical protein
VDLSDDLPPPRRSLFFPVVIATVFLAIIGMSAGLALASWHQGQDQDKSSQSSSSTPAVAPASSAPTGEPCPSQTQTIAEALGNARGTLRIQLKLVTKSSHVWICEDDAGQLFYQANREDENGTWIEGQTALFLTGVRSDGDGGYTVTDKKGTTSFSINSTRLQIVHKDGTVETQPAV